MGGKMKKKLPIILVLLLLTAIILACGSSKSYKQFTGGHEFGEDQRAYRSNLNPVEVYGYSFEVYDEYDQQPRASRVKPLPTPDKKTYVVAMYDLEGEEEGEPIEIEERKMH